MNIIDDDTNWSDMTYEQKALLDQFLEKGAISRKQHDKSLHDLIDKMDEGTKNNSEV